MELTRKEVEDIIDYLRTSIINNKVINDKIFVDTDLEGSDLIKGVTNGFLSQLLETITGTFVEIKGEVELLYKCPCCGYKTLSESYDTEKGTGYDICCYCGWEDDGTTELNIYRSINKGCINDYREKIKKNRNQYYIQKWNL